MNHQSRTAFTPADVQVETSGKVPPGAVDEARERVAALGRFTHRPILFARVVLSRATGPAIEKPSGARAVLDVNGHPVHAHASGHTMHQAIAELQDRLRTRIEKVVHH